MLQDGGLEPIAERAKGGLLKGRMRNREEWRQGRRTQVPITAWKVSQKRATLR